MNKVFLGLLLIGCMALSQTNQARELSRYHSQKFGFSLDYPANWKIDPDEGNDYIALYHPDALIHQKRTLELVSGLKIEIWATAEPAEITEYFQSNKLQVFPGTTEQYFVRDKRCLTLATVKTGPHWKFLILGYIPEKNKEAVYVPLYQKVVESFRLD